MGLSSKQIRRAVLKHTDREHSLPSNGLIAAAKDIKDRKAKKEIRSEKARIKQARFHASGVLLSLAPAAFKHIIRLKGEHQGGWVGGCVLLLICTLQAA